MASTDDVWLITGSSRGLGLALAREVLARGYRCIATARRAEDLRTLVAAHPSRALALDLDVTDAAAREAAVARGEAVFGAIDVLVNNAGFGYNAAIEEGEDERIRALFEANFFGLAALVRRVLPGMRARGRGHVINMSSGGGVDGTMGSGYYSASKFAVEGLSDALAREVAPLGIRVSVIEPGPFRTDFFGTSITETATPIAAYAGTAGKRRAELRALSGRQAGDPARAARAIVDLYESPRPPLRLALGKSVYDRIHARLCDHLAMLEASKEVTVGTDFPP